jgi:hypothetical protein
LTTKLLGKGALNGSDIRFAIELRGDKEGSRRQDDLVLNDSLRITQTNIALTSLVNGKGVNVAQGRKCHGTSIMFSIEKVVWAMPLPDKMPLRTSDGHTQRTASNRDAKARQQGLHTRIFRRFDLDG